MPKTQSPWKQMQLLQAECWGRGGGSGSGCFPPRSQREHTREAPREQARDWGLDSLSESQRVKKGRFLFPKSCVHPLNRLKLRKSQPGGKGFSPQ